jgi:hypothetical protein
MRADRPTRVNHPNLARPTTPGTLDRWTDGEIFRAIRNGLDAEGNWLTIMTYTNVNRLSDAGCYDPASQVGYATVRHNSCHPVLKQLDFFR